MGSYLNAITPETEKTTHYFWAQAHNFRLDEPQVTDMLFEQISATFDQDREVFETQQRWIDLAPDAPRVNVPTDAGQIQSLRLLRKRIEEEARDRPDLASASRRPRPRSSSNTVVSTTIKAGGASAR